MSANWTRLGGVALGVLSAAAVARGQVMTVTGQDRHIEGTSTNTAEDSSVTVFGPLRFDAPMGDYGNWIENFNLPGNISGQANQDGGWDGLNTLQLNAFGLTLGGGGGPGTAGTTVVTNTFSYTFQIMQPATYTLNAFFGSMLPVVLSFKLDGPGVAIHQDSSMVDLVQFNNLTGSFAPGTYTMTLEGTGTVSYVGPGGNGAGGGGNQPLLTLAVEAAPCRADFNGVGGVTVSDIFAFLSAWFAGDQRADFNGVGGVTVSDIFAFLGAWFAGCP